MGQPCKTLTSVFIILLLKVLLRQDDSTSKVDVSNVPMWTPLTKELPGLVVLAFDSSSMDHKVQLCITKSCNGLPAAIHDGNDGSTIKTIKPTILKKLGDTTTAAAFSPNGAYVMIAGKKNAIICDAKNDTDELDCWLARNSGGKGILNTRNITAVEFSPNYHGVGRVYRWLC